jgi:replicative DNA helicase
MLLDLLTEDKEYQDPTAPHTDGIMNVLTQQTPQGERNSQYTRFAGTLRAQGIGVSMIEGILSAVNKSTSTGLLESEIKGIVKSISRYTPRLEARTPQGNDILSVNDCFERWKRNRAQSTRIETGWTRFDTAIHTFSRGEVLTIAGRSGTGKTNLALQLSRRIADCLKSHCLFCSLEMDGAAVFFRLANEHYSRTSQGARTAAETFGRIDTAFAAQVHEANNRILIVDRDSLTLEQIELYLTIARESRPIDLLTVDYLGYVRDCERSGSTYEHVSRVSKAAKALAKRQQVRIMLLCQTSREGRDGTEPVALHHLRDSGAIEESADYVLGLWHSTEENRIHCEILKNRTGARGTRFDLINQGLALSEDEYADNKKLNKI